MFFSRLALAVCGLSAMICAGCGGSGPKLYPASGTVNYEGKPLADASIVFIPQGGRPSIGATDASGNYTMSTGGKPGVPAGTYSVTVSKSSGEAGGSDVQLPPSDAQMSEEEINKMKEQMQEQMRGMDKRARPKPAIPLKYSLPEGSGLSATVTAEKHEFNFDLTP